MLSGSGGLCRHASSSVILHASCTFASCVGEDLLQKEPSKSGPTFMEGEMHVWLGCSLGFAHRLLPCSQQLGTGQIGATCLRLF